MTNETKISNKAKQDKNIYENTIEFAFCCTDAPIHGSRFKCSWYLISDIWLERKWIFFLSLWVPILDSILVRCGSNCPRLHLISTNSHLIQTCGSLVHASSVSVFIRNSVLLCLEDTVSLESSFTSGSYPPVASLSHKSLSTEKKHIIETHPINYWRFQNCSFFVHCPVVGPCVSSHIL